MLDITIRLLPHGEEEGAKVVGHARICNMMRHFQGSPLGTFHAYFETWEPPSNQIHTVGSAVVEDYPRFEGSVWDLVATMLRASGHGDSRDRLP